jgi:hypothetical protein
MSGDLCIAIRWRQVRRCVERALCSAGVPGGSFTTQHEQRRETDIPAGGSHLQFTLPQRVLAAESLDEAHLGGQAGLPMRRIACSKSRSISAALVLRRRAALVREYWSTSRNR